jgi:predicted metal-dependent hydrolase
MPAKEYELDEIGRVHVYKRRGVKNMRLSVAADGKVRVTIPAWATYASAIGFAESRRQWIRSNLPQQTAILTDGQHIGKAHRLYFSSGPVEAARTRLAGSEIRVVRPPYMLAGHPEVQAAAVKASVRALRIEAEKLLPGRLRSLADRYGFDYTDVRVKQLKGRWGSCDNQRRIILNLFLMQLPWHLVDYVLLHELVHTRHMNHGPGFWAEFLRHEPQAKAYRTQIKRHKPILEAAEAAGAMA